MLTFSCTLYNIHKEICGKSIYFIAIGFAYTVTAPRSARPKP